MLLDEEANAVAGVGNRVLLRLLDHLAGDAAPQGGHVVKRTLLRIGRER